MPPKPSTANPQTSPHPYVQLRRSHRLRNEAKRFWRAMGKTSLNGAAGAEETLNQKEYFLLHARITRALAPELSKADARASAGEDWVDDMQGQNEFMSFDNFAKGLFGIADMWTDTIDEDAYTTFLNKLFLSITDEDILARPSHHGCEFVSLVVR